MENVIYDNNNNPIVITNTQIESNSRRTRKNGFITNIDINELNSLYLKHYGVFENGKLVGVYDPYTGELVKDASVLDLDHIIAVVAHGGTILFNCIPAQSNINKSKNGTHLDEWWLQQSFYKEENTEKILDYIFEAYDIVLDNFSLQEIIKEEIKEVKKEEKEERKRLEEAPLETTQKELQKEYKEEKVYDYVIFLKNLIGLVKEENRNKYNKKLENLESKASFKEFKDYEDLQNILTNIIKQNNILTNEVDDRHELTIMSKYNLVKLFNKLKKEPKENWTNIIVSRLSKIEKLLKKNDCTLSTFYENIDKKIGKFLLEEEINEEEFYKVLEKTELSTHDEISAIIKYVKSDENKSNKLPSQHDEKKEIKKLGVKVQSVKGINSRTGRINSKISKQDLIRLGTSEYESLRNLYDDIIQSYQKAKEQSNNTYIIRDYEEAIKEVEKNNIQIKYHMIDYYENIEDDPEIDEIIKYVKSDENKFNKLPSQYDEKKEIKKLGQKVQSVKAIVKSTGRINSKISKKNLIDLGTSEYESLRNLYDDIIQTYNKVKEQSNNIYIIRDYEEAIIETKKEVEKNNIQIKYFITIEDDPEIDAIIKYVKSDENKSHRLPSIYDPNEKIKKLGRKVQRVKGLNSRTGRLGSKISKKNLIDLGTSEYEALINLYEGIIQTYSKVKEQSNNTYIIRDYEEVIKEVEKINIPIKYHIIDYYENIEDDPKIDEIIKYVKSNGSHILPSQFDTNEKIKKLGQKVQNVKKIYSRTGRLTSKISKKNLIDLGTSEYEALRNLYDDIIQSYKFAKEQSNNAYIIRDYEEAIEYINELELDEINKGRSI